MNLYFRFFILLLKSFFYSEESNIFSTCTSYFIVNPLDLDLNFHMNNGRYLSIMDLGRTDLMLKAKIFWKLFRLGYYPVVVSESIRFKKSLELFHKFQVISQIESWDNSDFYIKQTFVKNNEVVAVGYIKGRFKRRNQRGSVKTEEIFNLIDVKVELEKKSEISIAQLNIENKLKDEIVL